MTPFKNRRPRRVLAAVGVVAALAVSVVPATASVADNPAYAAALPKGYVSALPNSSWTISDDRSTTSAPMPGNEPGVMTFTLGDDSRDRLLGTRSDGGVTNPLLSPNGYAFPLAVNIANNNGSPELILPEIRNCFGEETAAGPAKECYTYSATVNFPQPQIDPVIVFGTGIGGMNSRPEGLGGCAWAWHELGITSIDGRDPAPGQLALLDSIKLNEGAGGYATAATALVGGRLVSESLVSDRPDGSCTLAYDPPVSLVQLKGRVSSATFAIHVMGQITRALDGPWPLAGPTNAPFGFTFPSADLSIEKTAPGAVDGLGTIDWGLTVSNAADSADSHGFVVRDAIPAEVTDPEIVSAPSGCALSGRDLNCALAPEGYTVTQNPSVPTFADLAGGDPAAQVPSVLAAGESVTIRLRAKAPLSSTSGITNTATVSGVDIDPRTSSNTSTVTTRVTPSTWTMAKTATVGGATPTGVVQPGDVITYAVTATSTHGPVPGVVMTDDLSGVLDHASFVPGSARLTVAGGASQAIADPATTTVTTPAFDLEQGQQAVLTYQVQVGANAWSTSLRNTVTGIAEVPLTSCDPCTTDTQTGALVLVQKNGVDDDGHAMPVSGAAFQVLSDDGGRPGAAVSGMPVSPVDGQTGRFEIRGLAPGTYWLDETTAPDGHTLLAQPAAFTVAASGAIALLNPGTDANVTVANDVITVGDGKAVALPFTGAASPGAWVGVGAVLLLLAAAATLLIRRRTRSVT